MSRPAKKRGNPETQIHMAVVDHLRARGVPGLLYWHTPNGTALGGKHTRGGIPIQALVFKRMGVLPGVADLILMHDGRAYALELKAQGGRATEAQLEFQSRFSAAGGYCCLAEGLDAAIRTLESWGLLRGTAT